MPVGDVSLTYPHRRVELPRAWSIVRTEGLGFRDPLGFADVSNARQSLAETRDPWRDLTSLRQRLRRAHSSSARNDH